MIDAKRTWVRRRIKSVMPLISAAMLAQCGTETPMLDLRERLVYSDFGSQRVGRW